MSQSFTVYSLASGMILRSGFVSSGAIEDQAFDGEAVLPLDSDGARQYVADGQLAPMPAKPSSHHTFDWAIKQWIDPRTLQSRIDLVRIAIKAERDRRKIGGALVDGKWFHSDGESRIQQLALVVMGANVPAVQWKTMDGTFVTMTQAIASAIFQASAVLDITLFANAERHLAAVSGSDDPEAYDFSTGWPEHFPV